MEFRVLVPGANKGILGFSGFGLTVVAVSQNDQIVRSLAGAAPMDVSDAMPIIIKID